MYTKQGMYWIVLLSEVTLIIVSGSLIVTVDFAFPFTSFVAFFMFSNILDLLMLFILTTTFGFHLDG